MTHHPRHVIMSFYDVPADRLEMVHQLFQHLSEVTQGSCNFNIIDPKAGNEVLVPITLDGRYAGEASIDDEGDISMSFGRGQLGLELRRRVELMEISTLAITPSTKGL